MALTFEDRGYSNEELTLEVPSIAHEAEEEIPDGVYQEAVRKAKLLEDFLSGVRDPSKSHNMWVDFEVNYPKNPKGALVHRVFATLMGYEVELNCDTDSTIKVHEAQGTCVTRQIIALHNTGAGMPVGSAYVSYLATVPKRWS